MKRTSSNPVPVTDIAGFLGAGKTTVLNEILQSDHGLRISVMVNDFGEINIDSQLIVSVQDNGFSLANGCICCTVQSDLIEQIADLMALRDGAPEYILIEISGVSRPVRVVHTLQYPWLRGHVALDSVISVVDGDQFAGLDGDMARLVLDQLDAADIILINKTDLVSQDQLEILKNKWLYPTARIYETSFGKVPTELLVNMDVERNAKRHREMAPCGKAAGRNETQPAHDVVFDTGGWNRLGTMSLKRLREFLAQLPTDIYRAKGIFDIVELRSSQVPC